MDIGRAYTFITSDPKWIAKILIGAAVSIVPILNFALYGYALAVLKRVYQGDDLPLPEWDDFGDYFVRGLLVSIGVFLWQLPLILMVCPLVIAGMIDESGALVVIGVACLVPLGVLYSVIIGQLVAARYAIDGEFSSMFEFSAVLREARKGAAALLLCALIYFVASLVGTIAGIITCFVGLFIISPWLTIAQAHLLGQAYRRIRERPVVMPTAF